MDLDKAGDMQITMKVKALVFHIIFGSGTVIAETGTYANRAKLRSDLFSTYQKDVFPDGPNNGPLLVNHSLELQWIHSLQDDVLTLHVWEEMIWKDDRLSWTPEDYGGVTRTYVPFNLVWLPDIWLINKVDYSDIPSDLNVVLHSDGKVVAMPPRTYSSVCPFDEKSLYSNNIVSCSMWFASWTHANDTLIPNPMYDSILKTEYVIKDRRWKLESTEVMKHVHVYQCCPNDGFPEIEYLLNFRRIG